MADVIMLTERKGSNPGGKCSLFYKGEPMQAYLKYCERSRLPPNHPFQPQHQPIYEGITLALAKRLGLQTPRNGILLNPDRDLHVEYANPSLQKHLISTQKPFYFVSCLSEIGEPGSTGLLQTLMADEKIYRDLLMITDVSGKKQNFTLIEEPAPHLLYIDVGCSFVDAVNGQISQRRGIANLIRDREGKPHRSLRKDLREARKYLERHGIITNHRDPCAQDILTLDSLIESVPQLHLSCVPQGNIRVGDVLYPEEIDEIQALLTLNMEGVIRQYRREDRASHLIVEQ